MADSRRSLLVLGLGNLLCADDGVGIHAVEALLASYETPERARVLDGGTLGLSLLSFFEGADDVILIDAIAADQPAGGLVRLEGDEVAPAVRSRLSCHQIGVADLLDALHLLESYPERLVLLGLVPASLELDTELSPRVAAGLPALIESVVAESGTLGYEFLPKSNVERETAGETQRRVPAAGSGGL